MGCCTTVGLQGLRLKNIQNRKIIKNVNSEMLRMFQMGFRTLTKTIVLWKGLGVPCQMTIRHIWAEWAVEVSGLFAGQQRVPNSLSPIRGPLCANPKITNTNGGPRPTNEACLKLTIKHKK